MRIRGVAVLVGALAAGVLAGRALMQDRVGGSAPHTPAADSIMLPVAPGALFGAHVEALDVAGGVLAVARTYDLRSARGYEGDAPSIDVLELSGVGEAPRMILRLSGRASALALGPGASSVVVALADRVAGYATADGAPLFDVALAGVRALAVASDGTIAASIDGGVVLLEPDGRERARNLIAGTASDVMRVYTGEYGSTYHETHPIAVPAQPVALAFDPGSRLAVSTTDGAVHVIDGATVTRLGPGPNPGGPMGDYPRIVTALDVAWGRGHVVGFVGSGALVRFDLGGAPTREVHDGRCTPSEVETMLEPFPGDRTEWTIRNYCQEAGTVLFSPSGRLAVVDGSSGVRVRTAAAGSSRGAFRTLDGGPMAFDGEDRLVMTNAEGLVRVHALPSGALADQEPRRGAAGTVAVHPDQDFILVSVNPSLPANGDSMGAWTSRAYHLDGAPRAGFDLSGVTVAVADAADRAAIVTHEPFGVRLVDLDGRTIRDFGAPGVATEYHAVAIAADGRSVILARGAVLSVHGEDGSTRALSSAGGVVTRLALAANGARLLVLRFEAATFSHTLEVLDVATGSVLFSGGSGQEVALSPDGTRVAWVGGAAADLVVQAVDGGREVARLPGESMGARGLAFAPDGGLYFSRATEGLSRWAPPAAPVSIALGALGPSLRFAGRVVLVQDDHFGTHVLRSSDGAHLASVHGLVTGGFAVVASSGAVDGSADAPDALFSVSGTVVTRGVDAATRARFFVPGLLRRALSGEAVALP